MQQILEQAADLAGQLTDDELWQWCYSSLELLSRNKGFGEATDTEVRQAAWDWLVSEGMINGDTTNYWFYVDWYEDLQLFDQCVEKLWID